MTPEDWNFSRWLHERGVGYYATRKVAVKHLGDVEFESDRPWGTMQTDEAYAAK